MMLTLLISSNKNLQMLHHNLPSQK